MDKQQALKQLRALQKESQTMRLAAEDSDQPWKILIATMMSARTRDEVTITVAHFLFTHYPTIKRLARAPLKTLEQTIKPVNFYKTKAKNILGCTQTLVKNYQGEPPHDFEKLIELPGVGRKTANVFLSELNYDAIGIDTHVYYITRKLGWTKHTKPAQIEEDLKRLFPQHLWKTINPTLVRFGKTHTSRAQKNKLLESIKKIK